MNDNTEPRDFDIQNPQEGESLDCTCESVDDWEPIRTELRDFDIQSPSDQTSSNVMHAGDVETWTEVRAEEMRRTLVRRITRLFEIWVLIGLVVFITTGNFWLLTTAGLLAVPLQKILGYYFYRTKK